MSNAADIDPLSQHRLGRVGCIKTPVKTGLQGEKKTCKKLNREPTMEVASARERVDAK